MINGTKFKIDPVTIYSFRHRFLSTFWKSKPVLRYRSAKINTRYNNE